MYLKDTEWLPEHFQNEYLFSFRKRTLTVKKWVTEQLQNKYLNNYRLGTWTVPKWVLWQWKNYYHWNYYIWLLRVTQVYPGFSKPRVFLADYFCIPPTFMYATQGNPGLPWVIAEFWRHFQQNPGYFEFQGIPWVLKLSMSWNIPTKFLNKLQCLHFKVDR